MKRGNANLFIWLLIAGFLYVFLVPHSIPRSGLEIQSNRFIVASFPIAVWINARDCRNVSLVIVYGLLAGAFSAFVLFWFFEDYNGAPRKITAAEQIVFLSIPILMAISCVGILFLHRYLNDGESE